MNPFSLLFPLAASGAPTPPTPPPPPAPVTAPSTAPSTSHWSFKNGASEIEIQTEGNVTLDPDAAALFDLHGDGTLRVRERTGKDLRELTAQPGTVVWRVNGAPRAFDADGKAWLRKILKARPATPTPPPAPPRK
jgi:hypothetical protein